MPKDARIFDGSDSGIAIDGDTHPSYLPTQFDSVAVNRTYRGGIRRTRPPFYEMTLAVYDGEDAAIIEEFQAGTFQGAYAYRSVKDGSQDGIVVAMSGHIYFITIVNNVGYIKLLIDGNDASLMHTWFCQAEDWLYIQNGIQNPIAWDGDCTGKPSNLRAGGENITPSAGIATAKVGRASGVATIETLTDIGVSLGDWVEVSGIVQDGFNGIWRVTGTPASKQFTFLNSGIDVTLAADVTGTARKYVPQIRLTWTNNDASATDVEIQRRKGVSTWTLLAKVSSTAVLYLDLGVVCGETYSYRVRAVHNGKLATPWSNAVIKNPEDTTKTEELAESISRLNPAKKQMPIGTIMEYAHGRVWVSDKENNIYASDIIYGAGFTVTSNTRNFTEQEYWAEGGSFTPPAQLGKITGMRVMPYIGANTRGQGELVVMCENGAFSLDGSIPRVNWIDTGIQRVTLFGRGCVSPWSMCSVNNELFFRANDGWSLFQNSQSEFVKSLAYRNLSKEVSRWVSHDTPWMKQFASAIFFDNRIICTVSPYTVSSTITGNGLHRPHRGMVVLDLDQTTQTSPDAQTTFRWNGLWTGPNPTQVILAQIRGHSRAFVFSFDADNKNRLFELQSSGVDDYVSGGSKPIKSYFITKRYDFSQSGQSNKFFRKEINGGDLWFSGVNEQVKISASYRSDSYPCWDELMQQITYGCDNCEGEGCDAIFSEPRFRQIKFPSPANNCKQGIDGYSNIGTEFQIIIEMEGAIQIDRFRISADTKGNIEDPTGDCPQNKTDCKPIICCPIADFEYYKLIE